MTAPPPYKAPSYAGLAVVAVKKRGEWIIRAMRLGYSAKLTDYADLVTALQVEVGSRDPSLEWTGCFYPDLPTYRYDLDATRPHLPAGVFMFPHSGDGIYRDAPIRLRDL